MHQYHYSCSTNIPGLIPIIPIQSQGSKLPFDKKFVCWSERFESNYLSSSVHELYFTNNPDYRKLIQNEYKRFLLKFDNELYNNSLSI
jgi:hypothetical protein